MPSFNETRGKIGQEIKEMKSSLYYFPYRFPGIIMQINSRQEVERTSEMFMLYFSRGRIVNNLLQTLNL